MSDGFRNVLRTRRLLSEKKCPYRERPLEPQTAPAEREELETIVSRKYTEGTEKWPLSDWETKRITQTVDALIAAGWRKVLEMPTQQLPGEDPDDICGCPRCERMRRQITDADRIDALEWTVKSNGPLLLRASHSTDDKGFSGLGFWDGRDLRGALDVLVESVRREKEVER